MRAYVLSFLMVGLTMPVGARQQAAESAATGDEAGIYVVTTDGRQAMTIETPSGNDMRRGFRPSMTFSFTGLTAGLRLRAQPEFLFVVPRPKASTNPADMMRVMTMANTRPNQFVIVRFGNDKFDRIMTSGKGKKIELEVERLTTDTYRARPKSKLEPGEYALCADSPFAVSAIWTFGVDQ